MVDERIIICMKWGSLYSVDYVNVLYSACQKAMKGDFRFVCLTDTDDDLSAGIERLDIPEIGLSSEEWYTKGVWPKLALYVKNLHSLKGRCLFVDLDMVVLGGLDEMFDYGSGFVCTDMGDGWRPGGRLGATKEPGTCIFSFDIGKESQILEAFHKDKAGAKRNFINEQDFAGAYANGVDFWPEGWVLSFKRHLRQPIGKDLFFSPKAPPANAKIIAFHGDPRPYNLIQRNTVFWDNLPHLGNGQVKWMHDYWVSNGGRVF